MRHAFLVYRSSCLVCVAWCVAAVADRLLSSTSFLSTAWHVLEYSLNPHASHGVMQPSFVQWCTILGIVVLGCFAQDPQSGQADATCKVPLLQDALSHMPSNNILIIIYVNNDFAGLLANLLCTLRYTLFSLLSPSLAFNFGPGPVVLMHFS